MAIKWNKLIFNSVKIIFRALNFITQYLFAFVYSGSSESLPPISNLLLLESATSLANKIRRGKLKSRDLVEAIITRINETQPYINAVVDNRFESALEEAEEIDKFISSQTKSVEDIERDTPFLGIPFTSKDSISNKGLSHTAGLFSRQGIKGDSDANAIVLMKQAGAIPLAVTNISELCMWWESNNNIYGRTNNPYNTSRIVGGSSGGEAALQATAGSVLGVGSDVGGSIRMPSFFCGIFGHKSSKGMVNCGGQLPKAEGKILDYLTTGPMCRYATDLKPMLKVLTGNNSLLKLDTKVNMAKVKIFYTMDEITNPVITPLSTETRNHLTKVLLHFQHAYGTKPQKILLKEMKYGYEIWTTLMSTSTAPSFSNELAERKGNINYLLELFKWMFWCSKHTLPAIALSIVEKFSPVEGTPTADRMKNMCDDLRKTLQDNLGEDGVLIFPSHPEPAPYHNQPIFKPLNFAYTAIFNVLGLPVTQCPLGLSKEGIPLGIQVVGSANNDHLTIAVAVELEKAFGGWVPPSVMV